MELPTLNLSLFTHGNEEERQKLASDLLDSLVQHGFVKIINHGVPEELISTMWDLVRPYDINLKF